MNETIIVNNIVEVNRIGDLLKISIALLIGFFVASVNHKFDIKRIKYEKFFNKKIEYIEKAFEVINKEIELYSQLKVKLILKNKFPKKRILSKEIETINKKLQHSRIPDINKYELYFENQKIMNSLGKIIVDKISYSDITLEEEIDSRIKKLEDILKQFQKEIGKKKLITPPSRLRIEDVISKQVLKKIDAKYKKLSKA